MQSKILLITIFVAAHVNYLRSVNINICQNDNDVLENATRLKISKTEIVPILLISGIDQYPINSEQYNDEIIRFYEEENISDLLVVPVDTCVATHNLLKDHFKEEEYPRLYYVKNNILIRTKWTHITKTLKKSLKETRNHKPPRRSHYTFDQQIVDEISLISVFKNKKADEERAAARMRGNYGPPIKPLTTQIMTQPSYPLRYPSGTVAQTTTSTQPIAMKNQLPISAKPRKNKQHFVQIGPSNPSTTFAQLPVDTQSNLSQRRRSYRPTDLPQTSVSIWSTGMTQPATYVGTTVGPSTAYAPRTTWMTSPGTLVGEQPLRSVTQQTLDLLSRRDEPSILQPKPLETKDLLSTLGQHQEKDQNHEVDSVPPSTLLDIYYSNEGGSSKRPRIKRNIIN